MRIYTRTGDDGTTGLLGPSRERKTECRFEAIGAIDELNSHLGLCLAAEPPEQIAQLLTTAQNLLFDIGAEIARDHSVPSSITAEHIVDLEAAMDAMTAELAPLRNFILPGGTESACRLHHARTVCRRAEREILRWNDRQSVDANTLSYVNRLSDWLFVAARYANQTAGVADVIWQKLEGTQR